MHVIKEQVGLSGTPSPHKTIPPNFFILITQLDIEMFSTTVQTYIDVSVCSWDLMLNHPNTDISVRLTNVRVKDKDNLRSKEDPRSDRRCAEIWVNGAFHFLSCDHNVAEGPGRNTQSPSCSIVVMVARQAKGSCPCSWISLEVKLNYWKLAITDIRMFFFYCLRCWKRE